MLENHKSTLEEFAVAMPAFCACNELAHAQIMPLLKISCKLPRIKQLGLMLPLRLTTPITLENEDHQDHRYKEALYSILSIPSLKTLRIFNIPESDVAWDTPDYLRELDKLIKKAIGTW